MAAMQATGARRAESFALGLLAEALANSGAIVEGLGALGAALTAAEACGAHWADAELHRLRGEFLSRLASPDRSEVETCLRTALATARRQGTRGFELRAATSLARLWCDQGRHAESRDLFAPIYGWFTEGFDTRDLKEAKALLDELA